MATVKLEPFSEEQWDHFIENFENQPDAYIPGYQNTTFDQDESSVNDTINQNFGSGSREAATVIKSEPIDANMDWAFINTAERPFKMPTDNVPSSSLATDQVSSKLDDIRALYGLLHFFLSITTHSLTGKKKLRGISSQKVRERTESNFEKRQISGINQHLAALLLFFEGMRTTFEGMRTTLKVLTQHVNPHWELKTPTTPVKMQHGKGADRG